jgi:hypothetical protein
MFRKQTEALGVRLQEQLRSDVGALADGWAKFVDRQENFNGLMQARLGEMIRPVLGAQLEEVKKLLEERLDADHDSSKLSGCVGDQLASKLAAATPGKYSPLCERCAACGGCSSLPAREDKADDQMASATWPRQIPMLSMERSTSPKATPPRKRTPHVPKGHSKYGLEMFRGDAQGRPRDASFTVQFWKWYDSLREPARSGSLARFVDGKTFQAITTAVILVHAVITTYFVNDSMERAAAGQEEASHAILDFCFLSFYIFELCLRVWVHRVFFFIGDHWNWNWFDMFLVMQSLVDCILPLLMAPRDGSASMAYMRQLRILKATKILRTLRAMRVFTELRLMIMCILQSLCTLWWCLVLICFTQYSFAMVFVQGFSDYLLVAKPSPERIAVIKGTFGSVQTSMVSLLMAVTGGEDWGKYYHVIQWTESWRAWVFVFYIAFFLIVILNIVTGTFVNKAFNIAKPDHEMLIAAKRTQEIEHAQNLYQLFQDADVDGSGMVSKDELVKLVEKERHTLLEYMGLQGIDADAVFDMLTGSREDEQMSIDTFVLGLMQMTGPPQTIDVHLAEHRIMSMIGELQEALNIAGSAKQLARYDINRFSNDSGSPTSRVINNV